MRGSAIEQKHIAQHVSGVQSRERAFGQCPMMELENRDENDEACHRNFVRWKNAHDAACKEAPKIEIDLVVCKKRTMVG